MTIRSFTLNVIAPATDQDSSWLQRSSGPGVVWAHNFETDTEIDQFLYPASITGYVSQKTDPLSPYREAAPEFGAGAGCLVSRTRTARILDDLPSVPKNTPDQLIRVNDASSFINPATYYNGWYTLLLGHGQLTPGIEMPQELVRVTAINYETNTLTVWRGVQTFTSTSPAPAHLANTPIGTADQLRWNRHMIPYAAGQNGKATNDQGIANGYRTKTWTWSHAAWGRFRGGYWGHQAAHEKFDQAIDPANGNRGPWPPIDDYSIGNVGATYGYQGPTAAVPRSWNCFVHSDPQMCNEFWIQFRMWVPSLKMQDVPGKLWYLHNVEASYSQQLFMPMYNGGANAYNPNRAGGTGPRVIVAHRNGPEIETIADMDTVVEYNHWVDTWATWMIHLKPGRSYLEWPEYASSGFADKFGAPETIFELYVAGPTESTFTLIKRTSNLRLSYGVPPDFKTSPAIYNAFNPANYPNAYVSETSSSGAPLTNHGVKYAQVILSRNSIPCPPPLV